MKKYRLKVVHNGYIIQEKMLLLFPRPWINVSKVYKDRGCAEKQIDKWLEGETFKVRYIEYP